MQKLRLTLDTYARNFRFTQYPKTALDVFNEAARIVDDFRTEAAVIDTNTHLTPEGKLAARQAAANTALNAITKWHAPRLANLDADMSSRRAALLPVPTEKPDDRKLDFLLSQLRHMTPLEVATFYNSATDDERVMMEAASAAVGRVPMKTPGGLVWQPLLDAEMVNESILARATAQNPEAVTRLQELAEIRTMQVQVAGLAAADIREIVKDQQLVGR